jgi:hypothetical protein
MSTKVFLPVAVTFDFWSCELVYTKIEMDQRIEEDDPILFNKMRLSRVITFELWYYAGFLTTALIAVLPCTHVQHFEIIVFVLKFTYFMYLPKHLF